MVYVQSAEFRALSAAGEKNVPHPLCACFMTVFYVQQLTK